MTWKNGRRLATFTKGDVSARFDYDADGLRTTKTVGTSRVDYYRAGGLLLGEVHTNGSESYTINYMYDESGRMLGFRLDGAEYYYVRDYSGDVTGLINARGELIGSYLYDPWGVLLETYLNTFEEETSEWTDADRAEYMRVLNLNPIRYKSYYYDTETGFYYLQSRYYDPITTRFINADGLISTGTGVLGYNMFVYCNNNPILKRKMSTEHQVLLHSDQGVQYSSAGYCNLLKEYNVIQSMSRAGNPRDNAVVESFWGRFKDTLRKHFRYWERDDLRSTIEQAIYYFNNERPARKLNGKPPVLFRTELVA